MGALRAELEQLAARYELRAPACEQLERLLDALAAEPDPPTTDRSPARALRAHVADSLSGLEVRELATARRIADLGAGAGFPGLVLAIALPHADVDLIESTARKCAVIDRLIAAAEVYNARSVVARAEDWAKAPPALGGGRAAYEAVTARALAPLAVVAEYAAPLLREGGVVVAWKGARDAQEEAAAARAAASVGLGEHAVRRVVPFAGASRLHLQVLRKLGPTPPRFPRRAGVARRRPLG